MLMSVSAGTVELPFHTHVAPSAARVWVSMDQAVLHQFLWIVAMASFNSLGGHGLIDVAMASIDIHTLAVIY